MRVRRDMKGLGLAAVAAAVALAAASYFARVPSDPPGFYIDESSIAYNAHLVSEAGRDEHGEPFPLFFRAFGEYKNPVYVYLLSAVFLVTGPSVLAARLLSSLLGVAAAFVLGLLARRVSRRAAVGAAVCLSALLTPWLFEGTRLVFEVAAFPLAVALLLFAAERASRRERWSWFDTASLAAALALVTYTYTVGRALGPLLALGLALFVTRPRLAGILKTWALYAVALAPLLVFAGRHPGALTGRFDQLTYVKPEGGLSDTVSEFARHFLLNLSPWRMLFAGEENARDHVVGAGVLLFATALAASLGLLLAWHEARRDRARAAWWGFVLYGLLAAVVPASLTDTEFPQLRLIAFPVFLHALTIPAWTWLLGGERRSPGGEDRNTSEDPRPTRKPVTRARAVSAAFIIALLVLQGAHFRLHYHRVSPARGYVFDDRYARKVLDFALSTGRTPVHLQDAPGRPGYIQALWHGALRGVEASRFRRLAPGEAPPAGALVISTEDACADCRLLVRHIGYIVYAVPPTDLSPRAAPLPPGAFRAELTLNAAPAVFKAGQKASVNVLVRHTGDAPWPTLGLEHDLYAVRLRNRWLIPDGTIIVNEDGDAPPPFDLEPGDVSGWDLQLTAPPTPGDYLLELDLVQEGVARFGDRGSPTLRRLVRVEE